jgi:hypothetical protein
MKIKCIRHTQQCNSETIFSHDRVTINGIWTGDWFYCQLYTHLITTSNYSAIADLHILKSTRAQGEPSQSAFNSRLWNSEGSCSRNTITEAYTEPLEPSPDCHIL